AKVRPSQVLTREGEALERISLQPGEHAPTGTVADLHSPCRCSWPRPSPLLAAQLLRRRHLAEGYVPGHRLAAPVTLQLARLADGQVADRATELLAARHGMAADVRGDVVALDARPVRRAARDHLRHQHASVTGVPNCRAPSVLRSPTATPTQERRP